MSTVRVIAFTLFALPFAIDSAAQSQFTQPTTQAGEMRFREMDRNNDGVVTRSEWRGSDQSFRVHDWNGDGILSGDEVRSGAIRRDQSVDEQDAGIFDDREDRFDYLDMNNNGRIERSEWHGSADAFDWLDRNNDGMLSRNEVVGSGQTPAGSAVSRSDQTRDRRAIPRGTTGRRTDCTENAPQVVDDIYQQVLERSADESSAALTQDLASGRKTVRQTVAELAKSPEHAEQFFWRPVVSTLYRQMLNRDPDQRELKDAASRLASGEVKLPEMIARIARRAANNDEDAVRILYRRLLGREADPEGLRGFADQARRQGIESVARDIVSSPEYKQRLGGAKALADDRAAYETAVRSLYRHVLGRDPDPDGLRGLTEVAAMYGVDAVVDHMVASAEYERLYGDDVVPGRGVRYCGMSQR